MTDTGISIFDGLADRWLEYQKIAKQVDTESNRSEGNVPDRVDAKLTGSPATTPAAGIDMKWVGIGVAAVVGLVLILKLVK